MVLLFPSNDLSHGHEDPKGAIRLCQPARAGSSPDQGIQTQAESCLVGRSQSEGQLLGQPGPRSRVGS